MVYFDPTLEILLVCGASDYGIKAVLSHRILDSPIRFVLRTLTKPEKRYSKIEEGLACIYGVNQLPYYLFGHNKFVLQQTTSF